MKVKQKLQKEVKTKITVKLRYNTPHYTVGLVMFPKIIPFIFFVNNFVSRFTMISFFINNFIQTTASSLSLWVDSMAFHMITDLLWRHQCVST
jgi:hypothetical protein